MPTTSSSIIHEYTNAFSDTDAHFLTWHPVDSSASNMPSDIPTEWTRGAFEQLAQRIGAGLQERGCHAGDRVALCMGGNQVHDLAIRYAAVLAGFIPVTINWQADNLDTIRYKIESCDCRIIVSDHLFNRELLTQIHTAFPDHCHSTCSELAASSADLLQHDTQADDIRVIIFTSGTTGQPKGVELSYRSYTCNQQTFESFTNISATDHFALCCVNPLHHTNSTAMSDWALRRAGTHLHLIERYSTNYWQTMMDISARGYTRILAPTVSRHFDFLESLEASNTLPADISTVRNALSAVDFLIGSAPVGPQTVSRLQHFTGRIPLIRFGSTETCLQVMGTPVHLSEDRKQQILANGWNHTWADREQSGYWVGREHPPHTRVAVVKSVTPSEEHFMKPCVAGEPGFCITAGKNIMARYANNPSASADVFHDGWYLGLGDIVFFLEHEDAEGSQHARDFYWQSRSSNLLIRGGSNYSCDYIADATQTYISDAFQLAPEDYDIAVTGLRINSEHEDECCVALQLNSDHAQSLRPQLEQDFISRAHSTHAFSKGCAPDHLIFTDIPRNFKGALLMNDLRTTALEILAPA